MTRIAFAPLISCFLSCCAATPAQYWAEPIEGRVIDGRTKAPLKDVVVLAEWKLIGGWEGHAFDLFNVDEAVTDDDGRYHIPAWGPLPQATRGDLDPGTPTLTFFKSGYVMKGLTNFHEYNHEQSQDTPVRKSFWNGRTILLEPVETGFASHQVLGIQPFLYGLGEIKERCWWKRAPHFVRAVDAEIQKLSPDMKRISDSQTIARLVKRAECEPLDEFKRIVEAR